MTNEKLTSWDPLDSAEATDANVLASAKKREIKNILKSYVSNYDPFSELIQNAMDAAEKRARAEAGVQPKIGIVIDLSENSIEVIDNGCGFEESEFRSFLAPSISFKSGNTSRGNKGVGVTYIAYGFNDLTIRTKNKNYSFEGSFRRGRDWIEDTEGTVSRPLVEKIDRDDIAFNAIDQGTSFKIVFSGDKVRPSNLGWYGATTPEQWLYLLLLKTPLGAIRLPNFDTSNVSFDLKVISKDGVEKAVEDKSASYKFPHLEINASQKLSDVIAAQLKAFESGKNVNSAMSKFSNSNGLFEVYTTDDLRILLKSFQNEPELMELLEKHQTTAYGYFAYSTEVWEQLNDKKAKLRKGLRILRGGLQIASNRMVQGEMITIPLTRSIGHQNQTHVIVHFEGAEPDLGRKGFQPELKDLAEKLSVGIVRSLSSRREGILKNDSGAQANIEKELKVYDWIKNQEKHEENHPLLLNSEKFFLPTRKISVSAVPQSEQDVIVLFNQLIAGGVIRGIKLLSTSQVSQYDGIFRYCAEEPLTNYEFEQNDNPLGVFEEQLVGEYTTQPKVLEYKYSLDGLIREFESGVKQESEVDLAIFWHMGLEFAREYNILSYLDFDNVHQRQHHGVTHKLSSANSNFSVICLEELVQLLNDPVAAQKHQQELYGDDI